MILVTGGAGFIGTHSVRALCETGEECLLAQRRSPEVPPALRDLPVRVAQVDTTDLAALLDLGRRHPVTGIVNLATALPWPTSSGDPVADTRQGVDGFLNIVSAAQAWGVRRVVTASTIGVYGALMGRGGVLTEDLPLSIGPSHVIPTFKKVSELLAGHLAEATGVEIVSARISGTWGPGGHMPDPFFAAPSLAYAAAHGTEPDFSGMAAQPHLQDALDLCYVKDTGRALALLQLTETLQHAVYNVASGHATSNADVLEALQTVEPGFSADLPSVEAGPATWLDTERLRADTGFEPEWSLGQAAADYVAFLRDVDG